ncbi:MAG: hypothetical protein LBC02_09235, partial [Planctomycetaceae bacterium]|nr:hypothetical protein [Planctomycetaceae bacterium]
MKYCVILCSLLIFVAVIGCSQGTKTNVTEFIVTLDNQPLDGANLGLIPQNADGVAAFGRTGADGKCQTQTLFGRANGGTAAG